MTLEYRRHRIDKRTPDQAIALLRAAAEHFGYCEFTKRDLNAAKLGISATGVQNALGSWAAGIDALRTSLASDGIALRPKRRRDAISDADLFHEMQHVWNLVEHRPSRYEWEAASAAYHYNTYRSRFGGWKNACLAFLEWTMGEAVAIDELPSPSLTPAPEAPSAGTAPAVRRRNPTDRLRLRVLDRDGYRCVLCGRSPATERGVVLHLDHVVPFVDGGETTYENLRTLCRECNLGRGRDSMLAGGRT